MNVYFDLTDKQKATFKKLQKAYKSCLKAGIFFVDIYGTLEAYDGKEVCEYSNDDSLYRNDDNVVSTSDSHCLNSMRIPNEWTDDEHLIKLTPYGLKKLQEEQE